MTKSTCPHPRNIVAPNERLSRFIFDPAFIKGNVSQSIFKPPKNLTFSTYRTTKINDAAIWHIGDKYVAPPNKPVLGRVDLLAVDYQNEGLGFIPNGIPHPRHADVVGWNTNKPDDHAKRVSLAMKAKIKIRE
ncbi:MAG TPA: hypothetical protein DCY07_00330 [Rhodospirillaceae bacterium]|nr:hypothetical protein [Rhodospirillaceae bacterium]